MAILKSKDEKIIFELLLFKDDNSKDWIKYELKFQIKEGDLLKTISFNDFTAETELYLDCRVISEVPFIVNGIKKILDKETVSFSFEPVDERDFLWEIFYINDSYRNDINLRYYNEEITISFISIKEDILSFIKELYFEYETIIQNKYSLKAK